MTQDTLSIRSTSSLQRKAREFSNRPVLVTGSHRSGSTWVGKTLAHSPRVGYISEPFNPIYGVWTAPFEHWFEYVLPENEGPYLEPMSRILRFSNSAWQAWKATHRPVIVLKSVKHAARFAFDRFRGARPLMKDPIAFFSAEWLADRFDMQIVILVRHPAAFASSLKRLGWTFDFGELLRQPLLLRDHLEPFMAEIKEYSQRPRAIVDQAALLWKIFYHVAAKYRDAHPDWLFIRHEDLSARPHVEFPALCHALGIEYTAGVDRFITATTSPNNTREARRNAVHDLRRDSRANVASWKDRLAADEISRLRASVERIAGQFYCDDEW